MTKEVTTRSAASSLRRHLLIGVVVLACLLVGFGGWAAWASIHGAVIASATVVVESNAKKVQHAEGGIVAELKVREGDRVTSGQLLVKLDETDTQANLAIIDAQLNELFARQARLEAERDVADEISFPSDLVARRDEPKIGKILRGQEKLFAARRTAARGEKEQLRQRISQIEDEIEGLKAQRVSKQKQISLIGDELEGLRDLQRQGLVPLPRVRALEREQARLEGEWGELVANIARAGGRIGETKLRIIQIDQDALKEILAELRDAQGKIAELQERRVAAQTRLARTEVRSPRSGFVHQLNVHTVGGVIQAGEPVMVIIPERDVLVLEALVEPQYIDQVGVGQTASIRLSAFDQRTTPELDGEVIRVSADLMQDKVSGEPHYAVRIRLAPSQLERLGEKALKPGMPAEAFIQTEARTAISYLFKPLTDQITKAFRER